MINVGKKHTTNNGKTNHHNASSHHHKKNKIGVFYKINFFIALFISLILLYFIILVSAEPKSFPYITKKIESYLQDNFGQDVSMEHSYISFTPYGSFKISVNNLKINKSNNEKKNHEFEIPLIEGEFPLYGIFLLRFTPSKIRITNPTIIFHSSSEQSQEDLQSPLIYSTPLISFLSAIKNDTLNIKTFEMKNVKFAIKKGNKADTEILLKESRVKIESKNRKFDKIFQISSVNVINFNNSGDINLNANCKFNAENSTICNFALTNLATDSIADLNPALATLRQINTTVNVAAALTIKDQQISNLTFKAQAKNGSFDLPEFFSKRINFSNLSLNGDYNNEIDALNLSSIEADLEPNSQKTTANEKHLWMSLFVTNLQNLQNKKSNFSIKLENVPTSEIEGFWPIALDGQDIRKWVVEHIDSGKIENAFAKFSLSTIDGVTNLDRVDSQLTFTDLNLNYDEYFPKITALKGVASFTENKMNIAISSANVLNSKISDTQVEINDFNAKTTILNIAGSLAGNAADGLKHVDYKSSFGTTVENYLNGNAVVNFNIKVPLLETIELKDLYIAANEKVENLNNEYAKGGIAVNIVKNFNSNNFITEIDLTGAALNAKVFDIEKASSIPSGLNFSLIISDDNIKFKNINLWKKETVSENKQSPIIEAKISGDIAFKTAPFTLLSLNLKNQNFGKNDYYFSYQDDEKQKLQKISIGGKVLNLASFLQNKLPFATNSDGSGKMMLKASLNKVLLVNKKSLNQLYLSLNSADGIFYNSNAKASYSKQQSLDLATILRKPKENFSTITGSISDVGYLAEGLNISDTISGGNAKIKITNQVENGAPIFVGEVKIDNDITFYENNATKRLASNNLFSTVKDKIFSNNKTIFNLVKLNFTLNKNNLQIDSFIANNYKIGITAKGFVNLADNSYNIKGMIIPGFIINNLFGIGKIPLIGGVISGIFTGGEGGGLFGIKYEYKKLANQKEATFETYKVSAFVPVSIRNLFDGI